MLGKHCSANSEQGKLRQLGGIVVLKIEVLIVKFAFEVHFGNFNTSIILLGVVSPGQQ
jgi:hypothetical protein